MAKMAFCLKIKFSRNGPPSKFASKNLLKNPSNREQVYVYMPLCSQKKCEEKRSIKETGKFYIQIVESY